MHMLPVGRLELSSSLTPPEVLEALRATLSRGPPPVGWKAAEVLAGEVSAERVLLAAMPRAEDRGYFVTGMFGSMHDFEGRIISRGGEAVLRGELRPREQWRWQIAVFLYGPATVLAVYVVLAIISAFAGPGAKLLPWSSAPGHALSRLLDIAFMPAAAMLGVIGFTRVIAQLGLDRERRVIERILRRALAAAESARAAGRNRFVG